MKIAFFHELNPGGARRVANEFANYLSKKHNVDIYIVDEENREEKINSESAFFFKFKPKKWSGNNWKIKLYKDTFELIKLSSLHKKIAKRIDRMNYDVILVNPSKYTQAPFILKYLKTPSIYYCQEPLRIAYDPLAGIPQNLDLARYTYEKINRFIRKIIDKSNLDRAKFYIAPSRYRAELFKKTYNKKADVVYCGVDTSFFSFSKKRRNVDILYIGSSNLIDGYDTFKNAISKLKSKVKITTLLYGKNWVDDKKLKEIYHTSKILLCTARKEGLGLSTLEGMSSGIVTIAVNEAGHRETVIDNETGFLLPRNALEIAKKIEWLLSHPTKYSKMSLNSRTIALKKWSWNERAKDLEKYIRRVLV